MQVLLEVIRGKLTGKVFSVDLTRQAPQAVIGDDEACEVSLRDEHLAPRHCQLLLIEGVLYLEDLGEAVGSSVNGRLVRGRTKITDGDVISVADVQLRLQLTGLPGRSAPGHAQSAASAPVSEQDAAIPGGAPPVDQRATPPLPEARVANLELASPSAATAGDRGTSSAADLPDSGRTAVGPPVNLELEAPAVLADPPGVEGEHRASASEGDGPHPSSPLATWVHIVRPCVGDTYALLKKLGGADLPSGEGLFLALLTQKAPLDIRLSEDQQGILAGLAAQSEESHDNG